LRRDYRQQLEASLALIGRAGQGIVLYLRGHEGRGIGLTHKLRAYALQDAGLDTVDANLKLGLSVDARDYTIGSMILQNLGVSNIRLLTDNPDRYSGIAEYGLNISERVPLVMPTTAETSAYLKAKQARLAHALSTGVEDVADIR
jgi:3,4-dihydroxy 2-butanone 4-phosphate synthase / GTP cyclohydrolase II